jgi:hypothetical protein
MIADNTIIYMLMGMLSLCGLALFVPGVVMLSQRIRALRFGHEAIGEVVKWEEFISPDPHRRGGESRGHVLFGSRVIRDTRVFTPTVRYQTNDGITRTCKMDHHYHDDICQKHPVGSSYRLRYHPSSPDRAYDPSRGAMYFVPGSLVFAGALMLLLALGIFTGS